MQRGNQGAWAAESSFFEVAEDDAIEVQAVELEELLCASIKASAVASGPGACTAAYRRG
jgi:hypothetical protein